MKPYVSIKKGKFYLSAGWFDGEPFVLFGLRIFERGVDWLTVFDIQIARLAFSVGWER